MREIMQDITVSHEMNRNVRMIYSHYQKCDLIVEICHQQMLNNHPSYHLFNDISFIYHSIHRIYNQVLLLPSY
jgi:hypothetical protein